tara:strand:- start:1251 stop:1400 length:150 start_codon:yes stop_codon:yes gene_type:complete
LLSLLIGSGLRICILSFALRLGRPCGTVRLVSTSSIIISIGVSLAAACC